MNLSKSIFVGGISATKSNNAISQSEYLGGFATLLFIASLVIILIGIMKQDTKKQKESIKPEIVDELYKGIKNSSAVEEKEKPKAKEEKAVKRGKHKE